MIIKGLPLFYYPTTWIYVDDDKILLKSMTMVLNEYNLIKTFQSSKLCLNYMNNYIPPSSKHTFLKSMVYDEHHGVLHHTPVDFDITMLAALSKDEERFNEITAIIIDYSMPEIDGFALAEQSNSFPARKILLTGKVQDDQAVKGFNSNLIHRYVQKFEPDMENKLIEYLKLLTFQYFQNITSPLLSYLETENKLPQSDPAFINFFINYCEQNEIIEYYLIDKHGSYLCINKHGNKSCLVMQTDGGIDSWTFMYSKENKLSTKELYEIQTGKKIPFFGIGTEAWQQEETNWSNHLYEANVLKGNEKYYWTMVNL